MSVSTAEEIASKTPSKERLGRGAVAIIECFQKIPCNPCYHACTRKAIREFEDINDLPTIDFEKCNGCALCVSSCPGLAIFVVDETYGADEALVSVPYEFLPVPARGDRVTLLDREGNEVGTGRVVRVLNARKQDRTLVVSVAVPRALSMVVRNIAVGELRNIEVGER